MVVCRALPPLPTLAVMDSPAAPDFSPAPVPPPAPVVPPAPVSPSVSSAPLVLPPEPLGLWSQAWRMGLAGLPVLSSALTLIITPNDPTAGAGRSMPVRWLDVAIGAAMVGLLWYHRRHPRAVAAATAIGVIPAPSALGAAVMAFASIATRRRPWEIAGFLTLVVACDVLNRVLFPSAYPVVAMSATTAAVVVLVMMWGLYIGHRRGVVTGYRTQVLQAQAEQAVKVEAAREAERRRIAREMHDVLAHRISLLSMHAGVLAYREDLPRQDIRAEAELIQATAREALGELRGILGLLRATEVPPGMPTATHREAPQPTIADLPALVEAARAAGTEIDLRIDLATPPPVPDALGRHAHRITQECLTNARKHAPGSRVEIAVTGAAGSGLDLVIENGPPRGPQFGLPVPGSGLGLVGVAERASIVGGHVEHGATAAGGYRVAVHLPWVAADPQEGN